MKRHFALTVAVLAAWAPCDATAQEMRLPVMPNSVRFLVIGDAGTGDRQQNEVAAQIVRYRAEFPFTFAIMLGDNIYGKERPQDFLKKFERPYKNLLDSGVKFHAALGNHDDPNQRYYKPFSLDGRRYRTFKEGHSSLHRRRCREAAPGRHAPWAIHGGRVRHRPLVHAGRDPRRQDVLPDVQPNRSRR